MTATGRRRTTALLAALAVAGALAGCGGHASPRQLPGAAEPAAAGSPTTTPAGDVVALPGGAPEGIAVDPVTHLAVVALHQPDRLAFVDTWSLRVVRVVPVDGSARHLELAGPGGPVLVPGEDTNQLVEVALPSGAVLQTTAVGRQPHDATEVGGAVWVAEEFAQSVSVLRDGAVVRRLAGPVQPGGVAGAAGQVGAVDVRGALLYLYDATTYAARGTIAIGRGPSHVASVSPTELVVTDTRGSAVLLVDVPAKRVVSRLALPGSAYGLVADAATGDAWVTLTGVNQVVHLTTSGGALREVDRAPTVQQPDTVGVDTRTGCVFVVGVSAAQLQRICGGKH